jgi:hypothetical protein
VTLFDLLLDLHQGVAIGSCRRLRAKVWSEEEASEGGHGQKPGVNSRKQEWA